MYLSLIVAQVIIQIFCVEAFTAQTSSSIPVKSSTTSSSLYLFGDAFKNAFGNDESLGKVQDAGLSNGPQANDNVTINGKKVKAIVGQKLSVVAASARVKIPYNCKAGDCGTCTVNMNGRNVKACKQIIPSSKCTIST